LGSVEESRAGYRPVAADGGFADGPLLFPGRPGIFAASCGVLAGAWDVLAPVPVVADGRAGGPFLLPGWPAMPAPEFGAPGVDDVPVCAIVGDAMAASASAAAASLSMRTSCDLDAAA
jgi:hypothetical protein